MNPTALLALIADLYGQVTALQKENEALRDLLAQGAAPADETGTPSH